MSAYGRLRWVFIIAGLWVVMELLVALLMATNDRTLVLL